MRRGEVDESKTLELELDDRNEKENWSWQLTVGVREILGVERKGPGWMENQSTGGRSRAGQQEETCAPRTEGLPKPNAATARAAQPSPTGWCDVTTLLAQTDVPRAY
jgi:hypothetical protein